MSETQADLDLDGLESYLSAELGESVVETEVLHRALNLTIAVSTADREHPYVLRRPDKLRDTESFNSLREEYRLLERLQETAVPTPEPVLFCDDPSILGDSYFLMTYVEGEEIPMRSPLTDRFPTDRARRRLAERLVDTLAEIHTLDPGPFEDVCSHYTPLDQVDRLVGRLDEAERVLGSDRNGLREVATWLRENAPAEFVTRPIHGDYKPGNVFVTGSEEPEITGVLDWEAALLGDPRTELGYFLLYWRDEADPTPAIEDLEARHTDEELQWVRDLNENGFYPFTSLPGSPSRRELVDRYEQRTGLSVEDDRFYRAHAALTLAVVWEDIHRHRVEAGDASGQNPLVEYMSRVAGMIVDGEL